MRVAPSPPGMTVVVPELVGLSRLAAATLADAVTTRSVVATIAKANREPRRFSRLLLCDTCGFLLGKFGVATGRCPAVDAGLPVRGSLGAHAGHLTAHAYSQFMTERQEPQPAEIVDDLHPHDHEK